MGYEKFEEEVTRRVREIVGSSGSVQVQDVRKNNNTLLHGMVIRRGGQNVVPTIYLDSFHKMWEGGMDMDSVVKKILEAYIRSLPQGKVDLGFFKDFEQVKHQIVYRLVNREKNKELLADIPHVDFLDLAVCFYCNYWHPEIGQGAILIHNSHLEMWNVEAGVLMPLANCNTPRLMPAQLCTMDEVMRGVLDEEALAGLQQMQRESGTCLYVLSNESRCHGAAAVLYPGMLEKAAGRLGGSFYILPSSIHELLLLCDDGPYDGEGLHMVIGDVNRSQLGEEEVLSDFAYYYDASSGRLMEAR